MDDRGRQCPHCGGHLCGAVIGTRDGDRHGWRCADCGRAFRDYGKEALREMQARQQEVMRAARNHHQAAPMDDTALAPGVRAFLTVYRVLGGDPDDWEPEYRFAPPRRWRADLAHIPAKVIVEVDGGVWTGGRHVNGAGYTRDCEKLNAATSLGFRCYRLTTAMASDPDQVAAILAATRGEEVDDGTMG